MGMVFLVVGRRPWFVLTLARTRLVVGLLAALLLTGCADYRAATTARPRTVMEKRADQAFEKCWNAGGPPTLAFVAAEEQGRLYGVLGPWSVGGGMTQQQFDAVAKCMAAEGITPAWGFPPSMMGDRR